MSNIAQVPYYGSENIWKYVMQKQVFIFGTGKSAQTVVKILLENEITEWSYLDNNNTKFDDGNCNGVKVYNPDYLKENYTNCFVFIASYDYLNIANQLSSLGLKKGYDYIDGKKLEHEILLYHYRKNLIKDISFLEIDNIYNELVDMQKLLPGKLIIEDFIIEEKEMIRFLDNYSIEYFYNNSGIRKRRKLNEYFITFKILELDGYCNKEKKYLDVGSCTSPWVKELRSKHNIKGYALDYQIKPFEEVYYLIEDATCTHFKNDSIDGISMHSAFETFIGDADIRFVIEAARILKSGGKVVISPLYMNTFFMSGVSPKYYGKGFSDSGAIECVREDCTDLQMSRFYDVKNLKIRVLDIAIKLGFRCKIYVLNSKQVEKDGFVYLKFVLVLEKL